MPTDSIGTHLRDARTQRGLSLRAVAQALGVSASLLSQVETGKTQPSVATLYAIVSYLGISLDELLGLVPTRSGPGPIFGHAGVALPDVQHRTENPVILLENGVRWERLAVGAGGPADALLVTYEPGATSGGGGRPTRHSGYEYAYVLEGELTLELDSDTHVLAPGDSLQFDSTRPHLLGNRGATIAQGIWFLVGRRPVSAAGASAVIEDVELLRH